MKYKYIKCLLNNNPNSSLSAGLWEDVINNNYYISYDYKEIKKTDIDYSYMILKKNDPPIELEYRNNLTNPKIITKEDIDIGKIYYDGSYWKLNK